MNRLMMVRSRKMRNSSRTLMGSLEPRMRPPTSSRNSTCVTEMTATMNRVISMLLVPAMMTDGVNMSANPTISVAEAALASGTWSRFRSGIKGVPRIWNIGV